MKKVSLMVLLTLIMTMVSFKGNTQEVVYIEIYEYTIKNFVPKIVIITPDNGVEIIPLSISPKPANKDEVGNAPIIKKELEKWIQKGFKIRTSNFSTIAGAGDVGKYTSYVLVKE